jgi:multidrug resistance efflux pump
LQRKQNNKLLSLIVLTWARLRTRGASPMVVEQQKSADTGMETPKYSTFGRWVPDDAVQPLGEAAEHRPSGLDARAQSALLREAFEAPKPIELDPSVSTPRPKSRGFFARWGWRAVKSALGLGVIIIAGVGPVQRLLQFSSVEAVVNARLVSLRSPIDGKIEDADFAPIIGATAPKGRIMLRISNSRADRARLDDLHRLIDQIESERPSIANRLARLKELHEQISQQARAFQAGRVRELEERTMDLKAQVAAAEAAELEAASTLERTRALAASGSQTRVAVERAERDEKVAIETQKSLNHRLFSGEVELEAARRGEYVGDTYNDRPSSLQQADDLSIRIAEADADLMSRDRRRARLQDELEAEARRYSELSKVVLTSPVDSRIWEVLVSPGEEVRKGQDLLRLLDCSGAIVTVTVRESVFNQLHMGDKALFRFSGQSGGHDGTIVRVSGVSAPQDNLAIQPSGLTSGGYRVAVSIPDLASAQCAVGRSGTVVFDSSSVSGGVLQSLRNALWPILPSS